MVKKRNTNKNLKHISVVLTILMLILMMVQSALALSITNEQAQDVTQRSARITWNTDTDANATVNVNNQVFSDALLKKAHEIQVSGLDSGKTYSATLSSSSPADPSGTSSGAQTKQLSFTTALPVNTATTASLNYSIAVGDTLSSAPLTNTKSMTITGTAPENTNIRIFVNSQSVPAQITETGNFIATPDTSGNIRATVLLSSLVYQSVLGLNEIKIEIDERGKPKKEVTKYVVVDRVAPRLRLNDLPKMTNSPDLIIKGFVDEPATVTVTLSDANATIKSEPVTLKSTQTNNQTIEHTLSLPQDGQYTVEVAATDLAGNSFALQYAVVLDTAPCTLAELKHRDELEKEVQHFSLISLSGKTSEPHCDIAVVNLGAEKDLNINFSSLDEFLSRDLKTRTDYEVGVGGLIVGKSKKIKSDDKGEFETQLALQQNSLAKDDPTRSGRGADARRRDRESPNEVHNNNLKIFVSDGAGNVAEDTLKVQYQPGSGYWKLGEVQTLPNTVYSNNIFAEGSRGVEVSVMFNLLYLGPNAESIKNPRVTVGLDGSQLDNQHITVGETFSYYFEKEKRIFVMTKLIVKPNAQNVKELEAAISGNEIGPTGSGLQLDFALESIVSFNLGEEAFTNEKVFLQHAVGVETPFDYTKFLTPEMIADMLDELDDWIKFLEDAVEVAEKATLALTAGCAALSVWSVIAGPSETNLKATYSVCDRVWCPSIPPDCQNVNKVSFDKNNVKYVFDETKGLYYPEGQTSGGVTTPPGNVAFEQRQNDSVTSYKWVAGDAAKDQYGHKLCPDGMNGVEIRGTATQKGSLVIGGETTTASSSVRYECTHLDETNYQSSSARSAAVGCYSAGPPKYDDTKCFPWSADDVNNEGEVNTYDDIITSSKCMCVSGVRGHLANYLRVSQGFKKCLQQAQLGEVQGGYCERLFAQFACDLVAWGVKRALGAGDAGGWQPEVGQGAARTIRGNFGQVKENLEARYGGIVQDRLGLSSDQLVHKACVGAITGDWSDLENLFRQAGRIPVEPVIGPMLPESRFTSWNPFTGEAAINYYLTLGILSGGQEVAGSIKIVCDSRAPGGEYCPGDRPVLIYEENIYIPQDGSLERNLYYEDTRAKYWGNVAILDLSYKVGGQEKHYQKKDQIRRLNSFVAQCHFQAVPPTIVCETLAGGIAAVEFKDARTTPEVQKYYPGNDVSVRLDAAKADPALLTSDESSATDLYYVYSLVEPNGQVQSNKQNAAELRKWRVTLEDPKEIQIFKVKKFEQGVVTGAKGWYADKQTLSSAIDLAAAGASATSGSGSGGVTGNELTVGVEGGTAPGNLSARSIVSMNILTQDASQKIDCDTSRVAGEASCVNTRSQPFAVGRVSYQITAFDTDTLGKMSFIKNGALVHEINLVQPTQQRATATGAQGQYTLNVTLYHDVDRNGLITDDDTTVPFGTEQSQTKLVSFSFDPQRPQDCREAPKVEILYPAKRSYRSSSDSALITQDLKTAFTPEGGVIFTHWDDCNDIRYFMLFDSKGFENAQNEIANKESSTGTALSDTEKETIYQNYAIDYTLQANQLSDGSSFMGRGKSLTYNYNAEDRFDLILRAVDYSGNVGEDRVTVTKTGTLGVVSATPQESQDCARRGGTCKASCDAAERNRGVCGTGYCCG